MDSVATGNMDQLDWRMTPCKHLGPIAFHLRSHLCGSRGVMEPVYRCKLHVICTHRKYRHGQTEQVCLACDDYQPQEATDEAQDTAPGTG
jgi:hypothetical protein